MGNILNVAISLGIDYLTGSITAMLYDGFLFRAYDASKPKYIQVSEGLLQLTATVLTADYLSTLLTPSTFQGTDIIGMVGIIYFAFLFSPNMIAKLQATHTQTKQVLGFSKRSSS